MAARTCPRRDIVLILEDMPCKGEGSECGEGEFPMGNGLGVEHQKPANGRQGQLPVAPVREWATLRRLDCRP
jgi:hypothetical protein